MVKIQDITSVPSLGLGHAHKLSVRLDPIFQWFNFSIIKAIVTPVVKSICHGRHWWLPVTGLSWHSQPNLYDWAPRTSMLWVDAYLEGGCYHERQQWTHPFMMAFTLPKLRQPLYHQYTYQALPQRLEITSWYLSWPSFAKLFRPLIPGFKFSYWIIWGYIQINFALVVDFQETLSGENLLLKILQSWESKGAVIFTCRDLSKAFDCLNHRILMEK